MTGALLASLTEVARDLELIGARWALIGGFAVSARAEPRFTRDVDICVVAESDTSAELLTQALLGLGYTVDALVEHERVGRLATVRLVSPIPGGVLVDLLFASSGIEDEIVSSADELEIAADLVVPVATAAHLVVLKLLARDDRTRPQDQMDLLALRRTLSPDDEAEVRRCSALVTKRGFNRERDLTAAAQAYLADDAGAVSS